MAYLSSCLTILGQKYLSTTPNVRYEAMRKHMTSIFDEALSGKTIAGDRVVYIGEDVRHGGYVDSSLSL